ncbi:MAG: RNA helicase [Acidiferrobacteraceae bacterium]|nr:RNA helicase [Acidiferrobacteraceae bacterium]
MTQTHLTTHTFREFDLPEPLLRGLDEVGFEFTTPIQAESLPISLSGKDVSGQAQTGTGKTGAFLLAIFAHLYKQGPREEDKKNQPRALILAPTRELAIQIHSDAELLGRHMGFRLGLAYGGTGYQSQRETIAQGVDLLIGTPGRLIDYLKQGVFGLNTLEVVVLDEADRMFDLGFIKDIRYLLRRMPPPEQRLSLLFSATLSSRVSELAYEHMSEPQVVKIEADKLTVDQVEESVYYPANEEKIPLLLGLLKKIEAKRTLIFVNTKIGAEKVMNWLVGNDFTAGVLSGDVPQNKRERLLGQFKEGKIAVLVATDVAARGLHIPEVSHVFNYDLPHDPEDYVHRVGRTARAGASGDAISFACEHFAHSLGDIEAYVGHTIQSYPVSLELLVEPKPPERRKRTRSDAGDRRRPRQSGGTGRTERAPRKESTRAAAKTGARRNESSTPSAGPATTKQEKGSAAATQVETKRTEKKDQPRADKKSQKTTAEIKSAQPVNREPAKKEGNLDPEIPAVG